MSSNVRTEEIYHPDISLQPLAIIDRMIADVELTDKQKEDAETSYEAVTSLLAKVGLPVEPYSPAMFAQGSMRLGTTVKPIGQEEHDLDVVCLLRRGNASHATSHIYQLVWDTLGSHGTYREMRERKNRCIRLIYAHKFHLDITPAVPQTSTGSLFVPDTELKVWCSSHPVGFADWFKGVSEVLPLIITSLSAADGKVTAANAAWIEKFPQHGFAKSPLQRTTQLLKRDRDLYFQTQPKYRPSSILLTTLTAKSYLAQTKIAMPDLMSFVVAVVNALPAFIEVRHFPNGMLGYWVENPSNLGENFAENWSQADFAAFMAWHSTLAKKLQNLLESKGKGVDVMLNTLSAGFGQREVIDAAKQLGNETSIIHQAGKLKVVGAAGTVGMLGSTMGATVYHGK